MERVNQIMKSVAETLLEEEGLFFVTLDPEGLGLPLTGEQRLVMGGKATPRMKLSDAGIDASLSINRYHYDVHIPWRAVSGIEGAAMAFYCEREEIAPPPEKEKEEKPGRGRLKVVK